jgi:flavin reductase (DIM6/NTAB) family NADH-FMN oxidoreductase RutF
MNILTYATPVSVKPTRMWSIGLFRGTVAHENFSKSREGVLQLLKEPHSDVVRLLGGSSGRDVDKKAGCAAAGFPWIESGIEFNVALKGLPLVSPFLLPGCAYYIHLRLEGDLIDAGGHDVAVCSVVAMFVNDDDACVKDAEDAKNVVSVHSSSSRYGYY